MTEDSFSREDTVEDETQKDVSTLGFRRAVMVLMAARGLSSLSEVAMNAGLAPSYLSKACNPSLTIVHRFAVALNVSPGALVSLALCHDDGMWCDLLQGEFC